MGNKDFDQQIKEIINSYQPKSQVDKDAMWQNIEKSININKKPFYKYLWVKLFIISAILIVLLSILSTKTNKIKLEVHYLKECKYTINQEVTLQTESIDVDSVLAQDVIKKPLINNVTNTPKLKDYRKNSPKAETAMIKTDVSKRQAKITSDSITTNTDSIEKVIKIREVKKQIIIKDTSHIKTRVRRK